MQDNQDTSNVQLPEKLIPDDARAQLKQMFDPMPREVEVHVYTENDAKDVLSRFSLQIARELSESSGKVKSYTHDEVEAKKLPGPAGLPSLVIKTKGEEHFVLRMVGAPLGQEGAALVKAITLAGTRDSELSKAAKDSLAKVKEAREIMVFGSSTCPYCPGQMALAASFALERPGVIQTYAISAEEFHDLARKHNVGGVPHTVVNGEHNLVGLQQDAPFAEFVLNLAEKQVDLSANAGFDPSADAIFGDEGSVPCSEEEKAGGDEENIDVAAATSFFGGEEKVEQLGQVAEKGDEFNCDLLVLGGGPAGLTAAVYGARSGLTVTVLDTGMLGGQVALTPVIENYLSYKAMAGSQLASNMVEHAKQYAHLRGNLQITNLEKKDGKFVASTSNGQYTGRALLIATGSSWRKLGVPGEVVLSGKGVHNCASCDGYMYVGKKIAIVGGGNSALTDALHLKNLGIDVTVIHRRDEFRGESALAKSIDKNGIKVAWDSVVTEILGKDKVTGIKLKNVKTEAESEMPLDGVFVSVGQEPNARPARAVGAALAPNGAIAVDEHMRTNVPKVYAAGDVTGGFLQIVVAVAKGASAAHSAFLDLQNE